MRRRFSILIWFTSEGVMLKRIIWILFLLGLTGGCELFAHDGTVNISGSFRRNTCVLAQDSKQINVQLGDVSLTRFFHGNYGPEKSFIINLQDCGTDVSTVDVTFSGTPDGVQSEMLSIESGTDAASGLAAGQWEIQPIRGQVSVSTHTNNSARHRATPWLGW